MKVSTYIAIGLLLSGVLLQEVQREDKGLQSPLDRIVQQAKEEGRKEVVITRKASGMPTGVTSMAQIIAEYSLVRVKVKDIHATVGNGEIKTWYKLEVLEEILRQSKVDDQPLSDSIPP